MWVEFLVLLLFALAAGTAVRRRRRAREGEAVRGPIPFSRTKAHYRRLYTRRSFLKLGGAVVGAAVLAYSGADDAVDAWHREQIRGALSNRLAGVLHSLGERFWFAVWGGFALLDHFLASTAVTRWGRHSFEAMVAGLPTLWTVQRVLGASRPTDGTHGERFVPFADDNSASGHAFMGSIPFLVAARHSRAPAPRAVALALSPWVGWSRINDRKHYLSQVLLGYGIAWEAVTAVDETVGQERGNQETQRDRAQAARITADREHPAAEDRR